MKVLVIGGGGREHALAWKLAQSPQVSEVLVRARQRRHGDRAEDAQRAPSPSTISRRSSSSRAQERVALTIVGPEMPLVGGIVDRFEARA